MKMSSWNRRDWAVELPFVNEVSLVGAGSKPLGRAHPDTSIWWCADATGHEGWFYEDAGIHRHAWPVKADGDRQETREAEAIRVEASPDGLAGATAVIASVRARLRPAVP